MKLRYSVAARKEIRQAVAFYAAQRNNLGIEFLEELESAAKRIKEFPTAWQSLDGKARRCLLTRFPYGIIYDHDDNGILVLAVLHLHRSPEHWNSKL